MLRRFSRTKRALQLVRRRRPSLRPLKTSLLSVFSRLHSSDSQTIPKVNKNGRLKGKVAVVTGAAGLIGRDTSVAFAREGAKVLLTDVDRKGGAETHAILSEMGADTAFMTTDVSKANEVERMIEMAESEFGGVHILFNNAGISHSDDDNAVNTEEAVLDITFKINVYGVFYGCKYGIPALKRSGGGSIVNTASFVALLGAATPQIAYTASKGAVLSMTRELAAIHARENIRVNALCPGPLNTPLLQKYLDTEEKRQRRLVHVPMGRFGEPREIAEATVFLASDESSFVTGSTFTVDGGVTCAYTTPL